MTAEYLVYLVVGKLLIHLLQKFLTANVKNSFFGRLIECDLCLGWWVYLVPALTMKISILQDIFPYVPILSAVLTASVSTFAMHLLSWGWRTKYEVIVI